MKYLNRTMLASAVFGVVLIAAPAMAAESSSGNQGSGEASRALPGGEQLSKNARNIEPLELQDQGISRDLELDRERIERNFGTVVRSRNGKETHEPPSDSIKRMLRGEQTMLKGGDPALGGGETNRQVFGDDDRVRIEDTESYPFRTFGLLQGEDGEGGLFNCSATLIGPRTLLTAAHCVYNNDKGWLDNFVFAPGLNSMSKAPWGVVKYESVDILQGFIDNYEGYYGSVVPWDIAVVTLSEPIGDEVGWMSYGYDDDLDSFVANIIGYPGDMPAGTMWAASCDVKKEALQFRYFQYLCDTYPGSSGSSVYRYKADKDERIIYGVNVAESPESNTAVRINHLYYDWISDRVK